MKLVQHTDRIWVIEHFLSAKECEDLIYFSEMKGYEEAKISLTSGAKMMKEIRNNDRLVFTDEKLAEQLWEKLKTFCPQKIENAVAVGLRVC